MKVVIFHAINLIIGYGGILEGISKRNYKRINVSAIVYRALSVFFFCFITKSRNINELIIPNVKTKSKCKAYSIIRTPGLKGSNKKEKCSGKTTFRIFS